MKYITAKTQRVILPRLFDAVLTMLLLLSLNTDAGCALATVGAFVLDFSEAFWQIPICRDEQKYFCATTTIKGRRKYVAFKRAAQGSANAPMLWARVAALIMRLCQGLFPLTVLNLMCYVDDPLAAIRGTPEERQLGGGKHLEAPSQRKLMGFGLESKQKSSAISAGMWSVS